MKTTTAQLFISIFLAMLISIIAPSLTISATNIAPTIQTGGFLLIDFNGWINNPSLQAEISQLLNSKPVGILQGDHFAITYAQSLSETLRLYSIASLDGPDCTLAYVGAGNCGGLIVERVIGDETQVALASTDAFTRIMSEESHDDPTLSQNFYYLDPTQYDRIQAPTDLEYKFPWPSGNWEYRQGWHSSAVDIGTRGTVDKRILASAGGVITYMCVSTDGNSANIRIVHDDGKTLSYFHIDKNQLGPNIGLNQRVSMGSVLGTLLSGTFDDNCGYTINQATDSAHIHWILPTDIAFTADGWTIQYPDSTWRRGAETRIPTYPYQYLPSTNIPYEPSTNCSPNSDQISLFVDSNYTGQCVTKGIGEYPNPSSIGLPNDSITSVKVGSNVKAVLCKDDNYAGGCEEFSGDDGNLGDNSIGNDQVSSLKVQYRSSGGPAGYTWCANEGGYCSFSGTADVAYGANGSFYYKYGIVGGIACNNDVFGDPAYGVPKACYYKNVASTTGSWTADYYDEHTRWWDTNNTANFRCSEAAGSGFLDKNYGAGAPCGMDGEVWVGDYHGTFNFSSGNYVFWIDHDDGLKLWLNGANIADRGGSGSSYVCPARYLSGDQNLRAMLREDYGDARIKVTWTTDTSVCSPPPVVSNVQASDGTYTDKIQVTWNASTGAKLYEVYRATSSDGTKSKIGSPTATIYDDTGAAAGATYYYWVKACSDYGCSDYSAYNTGYLASLAPAAPSNLYSINTTLASVTFGWQDNSTNETGFNIYRWRDGDHGWDFYFYDNVGANVTSYTDSDLSCGYANFYLVTAYNAQGESERSGWLMMRTRLCTPLLYAPEDGATLPNDSEVELDWAAGDYATGYYAHLWGGPDIDINSGWISETLWYVGQLWPGTYNWQVKARDENAQESDLSAVWSFTVAPPCSDDSYEDNDLFENAVSLSPGDYPGLLICSGDDDWFSIVLTKGQQVRIHLDFSHALGDLDAELCLDQSCDPPLATGYSATDDEDMIYRAAGLSIYRLRIYGYEGAANIYDLHLKIENLIFLPDIYRR